MKNKLDTKQIINDEFYLESNTLADGVTRLNGHCKFCDLPIEGKSGFCDVTCRELYHTNIGQMTKEDWQALASRDKSILTGY